MRKIALACMIPLALVGALVWTIRGSDILGIFYRENIEEIAPLQLTLLDKTHRPQERVMMYDPQFSFAENLKNLMTREQAEGEMASGLHPGGQIIPRTNGAYVLPEVHMTVYDRSLADRELSDGTPIEEKIFHDQEELANKMVKK